WDGSSTRQLHAFELPGRGYDMSPDGSRIVVHSPAGSGEKTGIALFDGNGKRLARVPVEVESGTTIAAISADGKRFAAVLRRAELKVWDETGKDVATFAHGGGPLALSPDGTTLAI